jgi:membrane protein
MHGLALLLGPLAFGASLAAISFVTSISLGLVDEPVWVDKFVLRGLLPFVFMTALFGLLYWAVPNKPVKAWHAAFGGAMAALGFAGLQELFTLYIAAGFTVNAVVYGAFSAIPVFLGWLYLSWSVILIGALIVAELPLSARA